MAKLQKMETFLSLLILMKPSAKEPPTEKVKEKLKEKEMHRIVRRRTD